MQVYRDLLFNNICSFINLVYPVARTMLPEDQWQALLEEFFQKSDCQSPFYNEISLQFREYLSDQQHPILKEYLWLEELLQFEWLELYLDTVEIDEKTLVQDGTWQLTTLVWVLVYQYPVYLWTMEMSVAQIEQMPNVIMVWRDDQDQVCVESLSPLHALLIELIHQKGRSDVEFYALIKSLVPEISEEEIQAQMHELTALLTRLGLLYICP